jgi:hypothetical protein
MSILTIGFYEEHDFDDTSIRLVQGTIGLYFIYVIDLRIPYPFQSSRLIYVGMSESKQNSIGSRLRGHKTGQSGNAAIMNYAKRYKLRFSFHNLQILETLGSKNVLELESYFLGDFLSNYGSYPICNNQSGASFPGTTLSPASVRINWEFFS